MLSGGGGGGGGAEVAASFFMRDFLNLQFKFSRPKIN